MDRLTAVQVFVEVVDSGSMTMAADRLEMSTAMVSRYLATMEEWFAARLLHRTTRKLSLTDAGMVALPVCRQLLELAEDARYLAADRSREPAGVFRITAAASFADAQLTAALVEFQRLYPQVEFILSTGDKAADLVSERIDLSVRITNNLDPTLIARPLAVCRSRLCASPAYLEKYGYPQAPEDLLQHQCIAHAFGIGKVYRLIKQGQSVEVPVRWSFQTNETAVLRRAVLEGAGLAMLPTYYVGDDLRNGRLVALLPDYEPEMLGIHAIYLSRQHQPLALRLLVDFLAQRFAGVVPPWDLVLT